MKKQNRGFTIVELVIVIAVIAVLAAVLIPTFSSLVKKANLSADMQAVREMNSYLKTKEAAGFKPTSVEEAMDLLAEGNFDSEKWVCLTKGFKIYWYQEKNVMVLYSPVENSIVYPEEYAESWTDAKGNKWNYFTSKTDRVGNSITLQAYNAHVTAALEMDVDLSSSKTIKDNGTGSSTTELANAAATESEAAALTNSQASIEASTELKSSLGMEGDNVYVYASEEKRSSEGETYAAMQLLQVGDTAVPTLTNSTSGEVNPNLYYISITQSADSTQTSIDRAQKAAANYVYNLFVKINNGQVDSNANIVLAPGTIIDASSQEWVPVKGAGGYMGTTDPENPCVFKGGELTKLTSYAETLAFPGSGGSYFVTGFWGALFGNATVENWVIEDCTIDQPANNFDMSLAPERIQHSRNTIGIIGAVVDEDPENRYKTAADRQPSNVTVRNIVVKDSVNIIGSASASGLIGYVGGSGSDNAVYNGTLIVENCHSSAVVKGGYETSDYGPSGGLIAFACRTEETAKVTDNAAGNKTYNETYNIVIKDCIFDGSVDGYTDIGAAIGNLINGNVVFKGVNDFSKAKLNTLNNSAAGRFIGSLIGKVPTNAHTAISFEYADADHIKVGDNASYPYFNLGGTNKGGTPAATIAAGYYDGNQAGCKGDVTTLANVRFGSSMVFYDTVKIGDTNVGMNDGQY